MAHYYVERDLFDGQGSGVTSQVFRVADAEHITLAIRGGSASTLTLQGTNRSGLTVDLTGATAPNWSDLTLIINAAPDLINIEPGMNYLRAIRSSDVSEARLGCNMRT